MDQDILEQDDGQLPAKIKNFLTHDAEFRDPKFDPAPYLIKLLQDKQSNQELFFEKQKRLIQLDNSAQRLMGQVAQEHKDSFIQLLAIPKQYGQQLQGLKHGMASVKKKVRQSKSELQGTQTNLKQIHLNCLFNKTVYRRLKQVELKMRQLQTASLALKNHLYLQCAELIPIFTGQSIMETSLVARADNLKLRFLSQAIEQIRMYLFFTPKLTLPISHRLFERIQETQQTFNQSLYQGFFKRYQLFKRADPEKYLPSIWQIQGLQQKTGKTATVNDIIKGIMRISRAGQVTQSLILDLRKSINNILMTLTYFFTKQLDQENQGRQRWFTNPKTEFHMRFLSVMLCVTGALLRKTVIIRKICNEYAMTQIVQKLNSKIVLQIAINQIFEIIKSIYFPQGSVQATSQQLLQEQLATKLRKPLNFTMWPYFRYSIQKCLGVLTQKLTKIQSQLFQYSFPDIEVFGGLLSGCQNQFLQQFHTQFLLQMQKIFAQGRGFLPQQLDNILNQRLYITETINFCLQFKSVQNKSIREFVNTISFLHSLEKYFNSNKFDAIRLKQYSLFTSVFLYLKLNSSVHRFLISKEKYQKIFQIRNKQAKIRNQQKHIKEKYRSIVSYKEGPSEMKRQVKSTQTEQAQIKSVQQLKLIKSHIQMFLAFSKQYFESVKGVLGSEQVSKYEAELIKQQPSNYDQNTGSKIIRVWQSLFKPLELVQRSIYCLTASMLSRLLQLYFTVSACLYLETGTY